MKRAIFTSSLYPINFVPTRFICIGIEKIKKFSGRIVYGPKRKSDGYARTALEPIQVAPVPLAFLA